MDALPISTPLQSTLHGIWKNDDPVGGGRGGAASPHSSTRTPAAPHDASRVLNPGETTASTPSSAIASVMPAVVQTSTHHWLLPALPASTSTTRCSPSSQNADACSGPRLSIGELRVTEGGGGREGV